MYEFVQKIANLQFVEEVWLFGSRARNDHSERSDIDIAIVAPNATSEEWQKLIDTLESVETLLKIDCIHFDRLGVDDKLRKNIVEQHIVMYVRKGGFMNKLVWQDYFETLGDAINRLKDAVTHPDLDQNEFLQDATIQRFEFCIELYWKVLRKFLAYEQINAMTPREVLKNSYQSGLIDNESEWISMLTDRNRTSHVYKKEEAHRIFQNIKTYYPIMFATYNKLKARYDSL
jgi:nucleotidyltransferase substrate binding protein (TIGR01987 family)